MSDERLLIAVLGTQSALLFALLGTLFLLFGVPSRHSAIRRSHRLAIADDMYCDELIDQPLLKVNLRGRLLLLRAQKLALRQMHCKVRKSQCLRQRLCQAGRRRNWRAPAKTLQTACCIGSGFKPNSTWGKHST